MLTKILILGSSGNLGSKLYKFLKDDKKFIVFNTGIKKRKNNLLINSTLKKLFKKTRPDIVLNCIALTNIDFCEKSKKKCRSVNFKFVKNICSAIERSEKETFLIHFSTDQMYNNKIWKYNIEKFKPKNLLNYYVKSKILAENYLNKKKYCMILRVNFFGKSTKQKLISDWIYNSIKKQKKVTLFNDIFFSPLRIFTICKIIKKIIKQKKFYSGIYNLGSKNGLSKSMFAQMISKKLGKKLKYVEKTSDKILKVKRAKYMIMNTQKFEKKFKIILPYLKKEIRLEFNKKYYGNKI